LFPDLPVDVSRDGHRIDDAFQLTTRLVTCYFVLVVLALGYFLVRYRAGRRAHYTHGDSRGHLLFTGALAATVFLSVVMNLVHRARADLKDAFLAFPTGPEVVRVEILAQQWAWDIRYAGADGVFNTDDDIVRLNELRIPVGRPVVVELRSKDVVHSLYLPNFRIKQDATPGMTTRMWFQATDTGHFEIACSQMCGPSHYKMRGELIADRSADFDEWYRHESAEARRSGDPQDTSARWGWDWDNPKGVPPVTSAAAMEATP
jgi:cytochrome c oxidase subunit 2